jgi:hypothetical protein
LLCIIIKTVVERVKGKLLSAKVSLELICVDMKNDFIWRG